VAEDDAVAEWRHASSMRRTCVKTVSVAAHSRVSMRRTTPTSCH
jgi:hypothetical protein